MITEIKVGVALGGMVQIVRYEYNENYMVEQSYTYTGEWTEEDARTFYDEKYAQMYKEVSERAQAEVDRLMAMREDLSK